MTIIVCRMQYQPAATSPSPEGGCSTAADCSSQASGGSGGRLKASLLQSLAVLRLSRPHSTPARMWNLSRVLLGWSVFRALVKSLQKSPGSARKCFQVLSSLLHHVKQHEPGKMECPTKVLKELTR